MKIYIITFWVVLGLLCHGESLNCNDWEIQTNPQGQVRITYRGVVITDFHTPDTLYGTYGLGLPLVNRQQQTGLAKTMTKTKSHLGMDMSAGYPQKELKQLSRSLNISGNTITMQDRLELTADGDFGTSLVFAKRPHLVKDNLYFLITDAGPLSVTVSSPDSRIFHLQETLTPSGHPMRYRIGGNLVAAAKNATLLFTLSFNSRGDISPIYCGPEGKLSWDEAILVEAEEITNEEGGKIIVEERPAASKKAFMHWDRTGHRLEWQFDVKQKGRYAMLVRGAHPRENGVTRQVAINGQEYKTFPFPCTGGWSGKYDQWEDIWVTENGQVLTFTLKPGRHRLVMLNNDNNGLNLDWIKFIRIN